MSESEAPSELTAFVNAAVRGLCRRPDQVNLESIPVARRACCMIIKCDAGDYEFVIGSRGRNIGLIRDLAQSIAKNHGFNVNLVVDDEIQSPRAPAAV